MSLALTLLADVRWRGRPVAGERPQALLAALASRDGRPVRPEDLVELIWGDEAPRTGLKPLQVVVSRVRAACGADVIVRDAAGYRLGAGPAEVDSTRLAALAKEAAAVLDRDAAKAAGLAADALALAEGLPVAGEYAEGPLAEVRRAAAGDVAAARVTAARAASRTGSHADALPELAAAFERSPGDEALLADLLRSEAAVSGPAVALTRFERYRRELRDRLGADPGEALQRAQRGLLALDQPVRRGVRYDATELIGRDGDLGRLRALLASARVVSIVGAGGLGKTRLAHALARDAEEPAVHVVELVGVTDAADVAVEVGAVLGVRDSVSGRRVLTPEQRADVRARIAQRLSQSPGLLVLDNCEHLVGAVAELVAFLISVTPDLKVLTTSRAPLAIAAERVYPLGELVTSHGVALFRERAIAARPGVSLQAEAVASVVTRLDGLPLAIELAAAKVRAMSVEEIDKRLEDRFALLRGGDRGAPDRHRALLTVIEWSWNLLDEAEQRALRRLALFHDGFTLDAAETVLGAGAMEAVQGLVDQSLLAVREAPSGLRYRMLETVREFGRMKLASTGEEAAARAAQRDWAVGYARAGYADVIGPAQFAAIDALAAEETNLADELRAAMADGDRVALVHLLAGVGMLWAMRGEHVRLITLASAVGEALNGWQPPPDAANVTRTAAAITVNNALMIGRQGSRPLLDLLRRLGPLDGGGNVYLTGLIRVLLSTDTLRGEDFGRRIEELAGDPDRHTAAAAATWLSHERENAGDPVGAIEAAERALTLIRDEDGPWPQAMPRAILAMLCAHVGDRAAAIRHARAALPIMERLGASDDEVQLRTVLVMCAIADGRLADAKDELGRIDRVPASATSFGGGGLRDIGRAELALASGDIEAGLRIYRESAAKARKYTIPGLVLSGTEPWALYGDAMALCSHAYYARGADEEYGRELARTCRTGTLRVVGAGDAGLDYPASGLVLFSLGAWHLLRTDGPAEPAVRLLVLADRFAYNRLIPTMHWERITPVLAERAEPGLLARLRAQHDGNRPPDLLGEVGRAVERLPG